MNDAQTRGDEPPVPLVDEDDVAILANSGQCRGKRPEEARGLPWTAREYEQRIGARVQRIGGQHRDRKRDLAAVGLVAILRHLERPALGGDRKLRQAAVGKGDRRLRAGIVAAGGEAKGEGQSGECRRGTAKGGHRGGC